MRRPDRVRCFIDTESLGGLPFDTHPCFLQEEKERTDMKPKETPFARSALEHKIRAMTPEMLLNSLAVRLNGPNAAGQKIRFNGSFRDAKRDTCWPSRMPRSGTPKN
jgi:hypothetical protein